MPWPVCSYLNLFRYTIEKVQRVFTLVLANISEQIKKKKNLGSVYSHYYVH